MNTPADVLREQCRPLAIRDQHHDVLELLQDTPLEIIQADEDLMFWHALSLLSTVRYAEGKQAAEEYIRRYVSPGNPLGVGRGYLMQSHLCIMDGDTEASYNFELQAVSTLPDTAHLELLRSWATIDTMAGHMGDTPRMEQAIDALANLRDKLPLDQRWWYSFVVPNRADILAKRGNLAEAEKLLHTHLPSVPDDALSVLKLRLAVIALEHCEPEKACEWMKDVAYTGADTYWSMEAYLIDSRIQKLLGNSDRAFQILQDVISNKARNHVRAELVRAQIQLCEYWIQEGAIELADAWVSLASRSLDPWPRTFGHPIPNLILSQLEMAKGNWSKAITLLESLRDEGICRNHAGLLVGIYAHLAYAHASMGENDTALDYVKKATLAAANGNFAKSLSVMGVDVRKLLTGSPIRTHGTEQRVLLISERELEVLTLVAEGERNTEIAQRLYLSVNTVKNHLNKIFRTLGVSNRREAVIVAHQLGILPVRRREEAN